ncbi:MAG TPA: DnaD domain protein [Dehalococcoidia bacterium]|nr:DnaD domain protein [Dehalococcoidia bacterium]
MVGSDGPLFPRNSEVTPIPNAFFSHVLPSLRDEDVVRVVLHAFFAIRCKHVFPRFVSRAELLADEPLRIGLGRDPEVRIVRAIEAALASDVLISIDGAGDTFLFINDEQGRRSAARVRAGELALAAPAPSTALPRGEPEQLLDLYEANFGPLTPLIAEQIAEAQQRFPAHWLSKAMKQAVSANVRRWNYVLAILERWQNEGIDVDEETGRDPESDRLWERYVRAQAPH